MAQAAEELGDVAQVVHTAGLSSVQASPEAILAVDLVGVALVLEEFGRVIVPAEPGLSSPAWPGTCNAEAAR